MKALVAFSMFVLTGLVLATSAHATVCTAELYPPQTSSQVSSAVQGLAKGGILCLHDGAGDTPATYGDANGLGGVYVQPPSAGTSEADRRKIRNYPGETIGNVTILGQVYFGDKGDYYTLRLMNVNGSNYPDDTIGIAGPSAASPADNVYLSDLDITNGNKSGVNGCITSGGNNLIVTRDRIHDCGGDNHFNHCVYLGHGANDQVVYNVIFNCAAWAIHMYPGPINAYTHNNVIDTSGSGVAFAGGNTLGFCEDTRDSRIENNAITDMNGGRDGDAAVTVSWDGCTPATNANDALQYNCFYNNTYGNDSTDSNVYKEGNQTQDPMYTPGHHIPATSVCHDPNLVGDPASFLMIPNP